MDMHIERKAFIFVKITFYTLREYGIDVSDSHRKQEVFARMRFHCHSVKKSNMLLF